MISGDFARQTIRKRENKREIDVKKLCQCALLLATYLTCRCTCLAVLELCVPRSFGKIEAIQDIEITDQGIALALRLRKMVRGNGDLLKTLPVSFLAFTPHNMATERVVSH